MKLVFILFIFLSTIVFPLGTLAQNNSIFPHEKMNDILLILADPDNSSFIVRNRANEQIKGHVGDLLGSNLAEVVKVTYKYITLQTVEINIDKNGDMYEQPSRMNIQLSYTGLTNCYRNALPWLHGTWELAYDPDKSKTDWLFFNNKTCQLGIMLHDGRITAARGFHVDDERDGSFTIRFSIGDSRAKLHTLTVSPDRSKIYNETGAYYLKISDNYNEIHDISFRNRRLQTKPQ